MFTLKTLLIVISALAYLLIGAVVVGLIWIVETLSYRRMDNRPSLWKVFLFWGIIWVK